jgi:putative acetyltransferase
MEFHRMIRTEQPGDQASIYDVNSRAFHRSEQPGPVPEAELVDRLRQAGAVTLSLVAVEEGQIVGHILFSAGNIHTADSAVPVTALAPMAVLPEFQNKGIGSQLVREGLDRLRLAGFDSVLVLGHVNFYPRFGFVPAFSTYGVACEYNVPDEVFMAVELKHGALKGKAGKFYYHPEFKGV